MKLGDWINKAALTAPFNALDPVPRRWPQNLIPGFDNKLTASMTNLSIQFAHSYLGSPEKVAVLTPLSSKIKMRNTGFLMKILDKDKTNRNQEQGPRMCTSMP
jgi:hypothetical protein